MLNPMTEDFVRATARQAPPAIGALISAVDWFSYDVSSPIEYELGERSGPRFDKTTLIAEVKKNIWDDDCNYRRIMFAEVFNVSGLPEESRDNIFAIVEQEALKRIDQAIEVDTQGKMRFVEHGHHGRQYIARNSTARVVKEVLPAYLNEPTPERL